MARKTLTQAMQNINLALDFDEMAGIPLKKD